MSESDEVKNSDELATAAAKMHGNRRIEVVELSSPRMKYIKQNIHKKRDHQKSYGYGTIQFSEAKILLARQGKFAEDCLETQKTNENDFSLFYNLKAPQSDANS